MESDYVKLNAKMIAIKTVFLVVTVRIFSIINTEISPIITNYLALNQMNNSIDSSLGIRLYSEFSQYSWVLIIIATYILFAEDIGKFIKYIKKEVINNEKEND